MGSLCTLNQIVFPLLIIFLFWVIECIHSFCLVAYQYKYMAGLLSLHINNYSVAQCKYTYAVLTN